MQKLTTEEARQGRTTGVVRNILIISTLLAVIAMLTVYLAF